MSLPRGAVADVAAEQAPLIVCASPLLLVDTIVLFRVQGCEDGSTSALVLDTPDVPGHSYRISVWNAYAERLIDWDQEFNKPCDEVFRTKWSDLGGDVHWNDGAAGVLAQEPSGRDSFIADTNSHTHGHPSTSEPIDDDVWRL